ncbi:hypothetical protein C8R48DRAFT_558352, partial [Suillus tomentosus]
NIVERIFGILEHCFQILLLSPAHAMDIQARIPAALCVVHNFIREYEPAESPTNDNDNEDWRGGHFSRNVEEDDIATVEEDDKLKFRQGSVMWDHITSAMWADYQCIFVEH